MVNVSAIIVAAGKGIRMNDPVRKQYHLLAGRPIIVHALSVFDNCELIDEIFLVVPKEDLAFCRKQIVTPANLSKKIILVPGGPKRQDSVFNGLLTIKDKNGIVVVHDGVRPLLIRENLEACIHEAKISGACIVGIPAHDTLKRVNSTGIIVETLERDTVWLAQTPQAFRYDLIRKAHENAQQQGYGGTDDASLVERLGVAVKVINGSRSNIKITSREDLELARTMLEKGSFQMKPFIK
jgi:2-C-methyl-D-erythritol 4-phosphate cytidylyltransferase